MNAKEFLLTDPKIQEAVSNGYDIRLEEHEWIEKMELYAFIKQGSINTNVVRPESASASDGELLQGEAEEKGVSDGHIHYHVHAGSMQKCIICNEITDLDCG